jgi:hypothetical protein
VRDDANLNQLLVLANMESYNAILIEQGKSREGVSQVITPFGEYPKVCVNLQTDVR